MSAASQREELLAAVLRAEDPLRDVVMPVLDPVQIRRLGLEPEGQVLIGHILDVTRLGAIRQALCGEPMPPQDIPLGETSVVCQECVRVRRARRREAEMRDYYSRS